MLCFHIYFALLTWEPVFSCKTKSQRVQKWKLHLSCLHCILFGISSVHASVLGGFSFWGLIMPHHLTEEQARIYDAALCLNVGVKWGMQDPTASSSDGWISAEGQEENIWILFSARSYQCAIQLWCVWLDDIYKKNGVWPDSYYI